MFLLASLRARIMMITMLHEDTRTRAGGVLVSRGSTTVVLARLVLLAARCCTAVVAWWWRGGGRCGWLAARAAAA